MSMVQTDIMTLTRFMIENTKAMPDAQDLEVLLASIQVRSKGGKKALSLGAFLCTARFCILKTAARLHPGKIQGGKALSFRALQI